MANRSNNPPKSNDGWLAVQMAALSNAKYKSETYRQSVFIGLGFGILCIIAGFILSIAGIAGKIDWIVQSAGFTSRLTNATPGVVFVVVGMIIVWRYKPNVSHDIQFDREGGVSDRSHQGGGAWQPLSSGGQSRSGPQTSRERVVYRQEERAHRGHENRDMAGRVENRSMEGRIQHGDPQIRRGGPEVRRKD